MSKHLLDFKDIEKKDIEKLIDITGKLNPEKTDQISSISLLKFFQSFCFVLKVFINII